MAAGPDKNKRRTPRQERSRATVDVILEAAAQVFEARGYAHATTDRIAERAGLSVGSLYQYFPNKDAILAALARRHMDEGIASIRSWLAAADPQGSDLVGLLKPWILELCRWHRARPRLQRILLEDVPWSVETREELTRQEDALISDITRILSGFGVQRPELAAWVLLHFVQGLVHDFVTHPPQGVTEEAFSEEMVRWIVGYVGAVPLP